MRGDSVQKVIRSGESKHEQVLSYLLLVGGEMVKVTAGDDLQ